MSKDATITLRLPSDLKAELEAEAESAERSLSSQIVFIVREYKRMVAQAAVKAKR